MKSYPPNIRIKTFEDNNPVNFDTKINSWLEENEKDIIIYKMKSNPNRGYHILIIIYTNK